MNHPSHAADVVSMAAPGAALQTRALVRRFGGLVATDHVTLEVAHGARHALIGPNGAGKTTLVNLLTGVLAPSGGAVLLHGEDITRLPAHRRVARGLVRTFQINQLFTSMTPAKSLALTVSQRLGRSRRAWRPLGVDDEVAARVADLLARFRLEDVMGRPVSELPYGKRRLLEIAMAVACEPRVLLLDEPVAGVPQAERREILDTIAALPKDVAVLLIEHDMDVVFGFATRISVLVSGALFADGTPAEIGADPRVKAVYLGTRGPAHG